MGPPPQSTELAGGIPEHQFANDWDIWVFPEATEEPETGGRRQESEGRSRH